MNPDNNSNHYGPRDTPKILTDHVYEQRQRDLKLDSWSAALALHYNSFQDKISQLPSKQEYKTPSDISL